MKHLSGIIVFVVVFVAVGIAMHFALYQKPGIFVWTLEKEGETGKPALVRTTLELLPVKAEVETPEAEVTVAEPAGKKAEEAVEEPEPEPEIAEKEADAEEPEGDSKVISLFNGKDLGDWESTRYGGEGEVLVDEEGNLEFDFGAVMTGVNWSGEPPATSNYEISLDAMKLDGYDFFIALTFPVKDSHATFVVGGWGGGVVGISSVDDLNASENETMNIDGFLKDQWYHIRVRVTDDHLSAWIDDQQMVDLPLEGKKISLLPGDIELSVPIGIASFQTRAQYKNIQWRNLTDI
ncbi:MAG: DUF1080 domain-containing protein [Verrucomicrobiales bacterium]|nr:DUF1080 domain-containing protein [Verrucomicrobiales bacterium]